MTPSFWIIKPVLVTPNALIVQMPTRRSKIYWTVEVNAAPIGTKVCQMVDLELAHSQAYLTKAEKDIINRSASAKHREIRWYAKIHGRLLKRQLEVSSTHLIKS